MHDDLLNKIWIEKLLPAYIAVLLTPNPGNTHLFEDTGVLYDPHERKMKISADTLVIPQKEKFLEAETYVEQQEVHEAARRWAAVELFGRIAVKALDERENTGKANLCGRTALRTWIHAGQSIMSMEEQHTDVIDDAEVVHYDNSVVRSRLASSVMHFCLGYLDGKLSSEISTAIRNYAQKYPMQHGKGFMNLLAYSTPYVNEDLKAAFSPRRGPALRKV